jgi:hypothetical protein
MCNHLDDMSENKTLQVLTFDHHWLFYSQTGCISVEKLMERGVPSWKKKTFDHHLVLPDIIS